MQCPNPHPVVAPLLYTYTLTLSFSGAAYLGLNGVGNSIAKGGESIFSGATQSASGEICNAPHAKGDYSRAERVREAIHFAGGERWERVKHERFDFVCAAEAPAGGWMRGWLGARRHHRRRRRAINKGGRAHFSLSFSGAFWGKKGARCVYFAALWCRH
jgi:hypothetical protein